MARENDPYSGFRYNVAFGDITAGFSECTGLTSETAIIEYRNGNEKNPATVRKLPGLTTFTNITLKRGMTKGLELWQWYQKTAAGTTERREGTIVLLDEAGEQVLKWSVTQCWACKWEGPALNATANEVAIETLAIACEGLKLEAV